MDPRHVAVILSPEEYSAMRRQARDDYLQAWLYGILAGASIVVILEQLLGLLP